MKHFSLICIHAHAEKWHNQLETLDQRQRHTHTNTHTVRDWDGWLRDKDSLFVGRHQQLDNFWTYQNSHKRGF